MPQESTLNITAAAEFLTERRVEKQTGTRLPEALRPQDAEQAWQIQQAQTGLLISKGDSIAAWKCSLPQNDKLIVAPIFASTVFQQSPCALFLQAGNCPIEPEIAFTLQHDLPPRTDDYSEADILAAVGETRLALELLQNRCADADAPLQSNPEVSFFEHLADNLFNQGLFLGPQIPLNQALKAAEIDFTLTQQTARLERTGKHPNGLPQQPLFWLANFLSQQGIGLKAGQHVITGSYAGFFDVLPNIPFQLQFGELGVLEAELHPL
ncbi:hydratase [Thiomicrorhabdus cannonii]|uniref:hydratase n=1 Tax=Thiomicrorhabdus cannonii TaxID=2748011 RepID=UPI0015BED4EB|nr:hydratase [Thiomicrorhabdus cannonii]